MQKLRTKSPWLRMRLTRKLSRNLLYALLLTLSCIIIRDSIIILNAKYGLFLHQNIFLRNFPNENQGNVYRDSNVQLEDSKRVILGKINRQGNIIDKNNFPNLNNKEDSHFRYNDQEKLHKEKKQKPKEKRSSLRRKEKKERSDLHFKSKNHGGSKTIETASNQERDGLKDINALLDYLKQSSFQSDSSGNQKKYAMSILLAYPRSGSSFVGQVLSAYNHTMYMFEPLFLLIKKTYELVDTEIVPAFLDKIFNCDPTTMDFLRKKLFVVKSKEEVCETAKLMLVKTIRLRLKVAMEWLQLNPHIKVIHLVRDPRGIIASMKRGPFREKNATIQCQHLHEDYMYGKELQKHRYIRIKYENLVDQSEKYFKKAFTFMDLPYDKDVKNSVLLHTKAEKLEKQDKVGEKKIFKIGTYYSLYRYSKFEHDHGWKKFSKKTILQIEKECEEVMKELKYKPMYLTDA